MSILILWDFVFDIELPHMNSSEYSDFFPIVACYFFSLSHDCFGQKGLGNFIKLCVYPGQV